MSPREEDDDDDARMDVCRYNLDDFVNDGTTNIAIAFVDDRGGRLRERVLQAYILWELSTKDLRKKGVSDVGRMCITRSFWYLYEY